MRFLAHILSVAFSLAFAANSACGALANPSFELTTDWTWSPSANAFRYKASSLGVTAQDGSYVAELYAAHQSIVPTVSQTVTAGVAPGQYWTFSGYAMNSMNNSLSADCFGAVKVEYIGGTGGTFLLEHVAETATWDWQPFSLTTTTPTPAGITGVRFTAYLQPSLIEEYSSGILLYDQLAAVSEVPELSTTGTFAVVGAFLAAGAHHLRTRKKSKSQVA